MRTLISSLLFILALTSCMHNDGDIGNLFGTWKIETITIDGEKDTKYEGDVFVQFQTEVVRLVQVEHNYDYVEYFGRWSRESNNLLLDLHYTVDASVTSIPEATRFVKGKNHIVITSDKSREMTWVMDNITYHLKKQ